MDPKTDDDTNELPYGDSRDSENYHEDDAEFDKKHKKLIDDTCNLGPKLANAFNERATGQGEEPPTKKMKTRKDAAAPILVLSKQRASINILDDVDDDDDDYMMKIQKEGNVRYVPTSAMTGVESNVT
eukprot:scaffold75439_cov41-Attheya_sp.AAC.1